MRALRQFIRKGAGDMIVLDGGAMRTRAEACAHLRERLALPAHFGDNLDALYDALTDWPDAQAIAFHGYDENNAFHRALYDVLRDAAAERGFELYRL